MSNPQINPPPSAPSKYITILGLNFRTHVDDIYHAFSEYGKILRCFLMLNKNNESKGYAFVEYETEKEARNAIQAMNDKRFDGKTLRVVFSRSLSNEDDELPQQTHKNTKDRFKASWMDSNRIDSKARKLEKEFHRFSTKGIV